VMCQGLLLNTPARTLDDTKCIPVLPWSHKNAKYLE
jgi:hypothetical protein